MTIERKRLLCGGMAEFCEGYSGILVRGRGYRGNNSNKFARNQKRDTCKETGQYS
jgi:hypothetical protein